MTRRALCLVTVASVVSTAIPWVGIVNAQVPQADATRWALLAGAPRQEGEWSKEVNGVRARVSLAQVRLESGLWWLLPYLDLQNLGSSEAQVCVDNRSLHVALLNQDGLPTDAPKASGPISGSPRGLTKAILPGSSSMSVSLTATNHGLANGGAMTTTDGGRWHFLDKDNGVYSIFVRLICQAPPRPEVRVNRSEGQKPRIEYVDPTAAEAWASWRGWTGVIETPPLLVRWP